MSVLASAALLYAGVGSTAIAQPQNRDATATAPSELTARFDTTVRAQMPQVEVIVDATAAKRVLATVRNPGLTRAEALAIPRLPGNQGLIRKTRSYGRTTDDQFFARPLAAARHDASFVDRQVPLRHGAGPRDRDLGFYGDEVMYSLGYVMAGAIARERGNAAISEVIGLPGTAFVERYLALEAYGKSDAAPALKPETIRPARSHSTCARQR